MCSYCRKEGFDIEQVKEAAKQMEGLHDFRTFMKVSKEQKTVEFLNPMRLVYSSDANLIYNFCALLVSSKILCSTNRQYKSTTRTDISYLIQL